MKPILSLVMPAIRVERWWKVYNSILQSCSCPFELIIVGPHSPEPAMLGLGNVVYIEDWGSPNRAHQRGVCRAEGEYVGWVLDDGILQPGMLDKMISLMQEPHVSSMGKYFEGSVEHPFMLQDDTYYMHSYPDWSGMKIPDNYVCAHGPYIIRSSDLPSIGGWDCRYETCSVGYVETGVRMQAAGIKFVLTNEVCIKFDHMPGGTGDHGPMQEGVIKHDMPLFRERYNDPTWVERIMVDPLNWMTAPDKWSRRFGA